jgi:hypothetical protein
MCQSLKSFQLSDVTAIVELIAAVPVIVSPLRTYKFADFITHFIIMSEPLDTFKTPPEAEYLYPLLLRVLKEMRFLNMVGTCLTFVNVDGR